MQSYMLVFLFLCQCVWLGVAGAWEGGMLPLIAFRKITAGRVLSPFSTIKRKCFCDY